MPTAASKPILLIGMRGAGKTYIGRVAAEVLGGDYTDADDVFVAHTKMSVSQFVEANGWPAFRQTETEILKGFISNTKGDNHIVSLGGGVVETEEAREALTKFHQSGGVVIHITREMGDIEGYLDSIGSTAARPNWGEGFEEVWKRRAPWFRSCSSHEFFNILSPAPGQSQAEHHKAMRSECGRFFNFVSGQKANRPVLSKENPTSFLSLTFPDITPSLGQIDELTEGADAIELRVDLLSHTGQTPTSPTVPKAEYVAKQLAQLRLSTTLPIVYAVRSKDQGGLFPTEDESAYKELVSLGIRAGCEYVDLEVSKSASTAESLVKIKGSSHIIASWHDWTGQMAWGGSDVEGKYALCSKYGDVVKIVGMARGLEENLALATFAQTKSSGKPLLTINMGLAGQMSRILNTTLTPITHPLLPTKAAPGQLSAKELNIARGLLGLQASKAFFLFGSPIGASVSPTLHNTGFQTLGLQNNFYDKHETKVVDQGLLDLIHNPNFGGASVTIPLKLDIMPHLDDISPDAKVIGAVNTIVPQRSSSEETKLYGDNTDWQAIYKAVKDNLSAESTANAGSTGSSAEAVTSLVIGAGGTCRSAVYAMGKLSPKGTIYLFNRTLEKAQSVKSSFPSEFNIQVISSLDDLPTPPQVVVSTVPGASLTLDKGSEGIHLPEAVLSAGGGVVVDMAYKPHKTPLIQLAEKTQGWVAVTGVEILCLQGFKQFELWTGKRAPEAKIRKAVMDKYFE